LFNRDSIRWHYAHNPPALTPDRTPGDTHMALEKNENYFELTDDSDRASAIEAQFNEDALEEARRKTAPETSPDFDGKHCIECGEKIPSARLKLGKIRCIDCQSLREQKTRFFAG
jgi:RNA polymerase-binding transcription factor DksA